MNKQSLSSSVQSSTVQINKSKSRIQAALQPYNIVYNKYQVGFTSTEMTSYLGLLKSFHQKHSK